VKLHPFSIQLFLDDELVTAHFFHSIFDLLGGAFAQHGQESVKQLDVLIL
jgi:hypothetical protein